MTQGQTYQVLQLKYYLRLALHDQVVCAVSWDGVGFAVSHTLVQVGTTPPKGDSPPQKKTGIPQAQSSCQCRSLAFFIVTSIYHSAGLLSRVVWHLRGNTPLLAAGIIISNSG